MRNAFFSIMIIGLVALGFSANTVAKGLDVLTLSAERETTSVSFVGTADDGVLAVTCGLIDESGDEVMMNSVVVKDGGFSDAFEVNAADRFSAVMCANYDGGAIVTAEIKVDKVKTEADEIDTDKIVVPKVPNTGVVE